VRRRGGLVLDNGGLGSELEAAGLARGAPRPSFGDPGGAGLFRRVNDVF
jgi:hypothetical protein